ncbi:MAG: trypsin-like peptidase domain-containing protein [Phycisphaeraceae bacterium]|nr:trypsin-like peptidase domain-containing protein [Phycisphaeraceae bacterium]
MSKNAILRTSLIAGLLVASMLGGMALADRDGVAQRVERDRQELEAVSIRLADLSDAFRKVSRVVEPSVVHITAKSRLAGRSIGPGSDQLEDMLRRFFEDRPELDPRMPEQRRPDRPDEDRQDDAQRFGIPREIGAGSGWVWDDEGHIITNYHVVRQAQELEVLFHDRTVAPAKIVGFDSRTDIAVLKVDRPERDLVPARRADEVVEQGDMVFAFGSPFRFRFSMSQGIISGKGRQTGILGPGGYEDFLQTDAAINPGNSGGPLTNLKGEVVGMNTAIASRTGTFAGIGLAIPIDMIEEIAAQLIERGTVKRGYLGAFIGDDPAMLRSLGAEEGVYIDDVMPDSPAAEAGLSQGDVVTGINGERVTSADQLRRTIARQAPGSEITLRILRDESSRDLKVVVGKLPEPDQVATAPARPDDRPSGTEQLRRLGLASVRTVTAEAAGRLGLPAASGVLVERVTPGSSAAAAGLTPPALITHIMRTRVNSVEEMARAIERHDLASDGLRITVRVSDTRSTMMFLPPPPPPEADR